jgi:CDP-diacylglycerol--glycerol-3-phosphate 3-phosphatidyltransferase
MRRLNLPNAISIFRVFMIPVFMVFALADVPAGDIVALVVFVTASVSDFVDGFLARRWHQTTVLGAFMDPLADKLLVIAALLCLVQFNSTPERGHLSAWVAMVIIARELAVSGLRMVAAAANVVIVASKWGKIKTFVQMFTLAALIITPRLFRWEWTAGGHHVTWYFVLVMLVITVLSGIDYFVKAGQSLRRRTKGATDSGDPEAATEKRGGGEDARA